MAASPAPAAEPNTFYVRRQGWHHYVFSTWGGCLTEAFDCEGAAQDDADERQAAWDAAEAEEAALAIEAAKDALIDDVQHFLRALDRGHLGDAFRFSDGTESAFITSLRAGVAPFERRA